MAHKNDVKTMPDTTKKALENVIMALLDRHNIPGLSMALVSPDLVYTRGFGVADVETRAPVTERTRFCLGSLTKAFTSTLLASVLQERQDINWDTPISKYLGDAIKFCDDIRTQHASLRDILAHRMGILLGETDFSWVFEPLSRDEIVRRLQFMKPTTEFRNKFMYNNFMYGIAGYIAELLTGKSWEQLVQQRLFEPLGMKSATFMHKEMMAQDLAQPHMGVNEMPQKLNLEVHRSIGAVASCGSVCCSAEDMVRWMRFHLNQGKVDEVSLINPHILSECYQPVSALPNGRGPEWDGYAKQPDFPITEARDTYGMGWMLGAYRGYRTVGHCGELFGYDCQLTLFPDMNTGIFTCVNGPGGDPAFVANQLLHYLTSDLLLKLTPWLDDTTILTFPEPWKPREFFFPIKTQTQIDKSKLPTRPLGNYAGIYNSESLGQIRVAVNANTLCMQFGRIGSFQLYPNGQSDQFRLEGTGVVHFLHFVDLFAPSDWMMVRFSSHSGQGIDTLHWSLIESSPVFYRM